MKTVVFYDNLCSVCNYWVNWIMKHDKKEVFCFASLESEFAYEFSSHFNYSFPKETIVIWNEEVGFLKKSNAVIYILQLIEPTSFRLKVLKLFPKFLRDSGYSTFAYFRRYIPMRKCELPTFEDRKRFLTHVSFQDFINK